MSEYNREIEELLNDFENLQLTELVKQVNMQAGTPTESGGSNHPNNFERGEPSNPFQDNQNNHKNKHTENFKRKVSKKSMINDEFKLKNPLQLEPVPAWGYILNLDCVTDKRAAIDNWGYSVILSLLQEPSHAAKGRDVNTIYNLIIYSLHGIVRNWYNGLSTTVRNIIEVEVKNSLPKSIEYGMWAFEKYFIGQFQGFDYTQHVELNKFE